VASKEKRQQRARQKRKQQNVARNRGPAVVPDNAVMATSSDLISLLEALPPPDYAGYDLLEPVIRAAVAKREREGDGMPDEEMLFADVIFFMATHEYWGLGSNGTKNQHKPYHLRSEPSSQASASIKQLRISASWLISVSRSCTVLSSASSLR